MTCSRRNMALNSCQSTIPVCVDQWGQCSNSPLHSISDGSGAEQRVGITAEIRTQPTREHRPQYKDEKVKRGPVKGRGSGPSHVMIEVKGPCHTYTVLISLVDVHGQYHPLYQPYLAGRQKQGDWPKLVTHDRVPKLQDQIPANTLHSVNYIGINKILDSETTPWHGQASEKHRVKIRFTVIGTTHETIAESETDEIKMKVSNNKPSDRKSEKPEIENVFFTVSAATKGDLFAITGRHMDKTHLVIFTIGGWSASADIQETMRRDCLLVVTVPSLRSTQIDTDVSVVLQTSDGVSSNSYHFRTSNNAGAMSPLTTTKKRKVLLTTDSYGIFNSLLGIMPNTMVSTKNDRLSTIVPNMSNSSDLGCDSTDPGYDSMDPFTSYTRVSDDGSNSEHLFKTAGKKCQGDHDIKSDIPQTQPASSLQIPLFEVSQNARLMSPSTECGLTSDAGAMSPLTTTKKRKVLLTTDSYGIFNSLLGIMPNTMVSTKNDRLSTIVPNMSNSSDLGCDSTDPGYDSMDPFTSYAQVSDDGSNSEHLFKTAGKKCQGDHDIKSDIPQTQPASSLQIPLFEVSQNARLMSPSTECGLTSDAEKSPQSDPVTESYVSFESYFNQMFPANLPKLEDFTGLSSQLDITEGNILM